MTSSPLLSLRHITKIYSSGGGEIRALNDVSFNVASGEFIAIMGPSGSGKSSLMHILGALDKPTQGTYLLRGKNISSLTKDELARLRNRQIGFVFQAFNLMSQMTVLKNVELPMLYAGIVAHKRHQRAMSILEKVGLKAKAHYLSNRISGGQIQRVAIARALIMNPAIILADEPTGNLDSNTAQSIMALFQEFNRLGHTIIIITHESDMARYAKRIIYIRDGCIEDNYASK